MSSGCVHQMHSQGGRLMATLHETKLGATMRGHATNPLLCLFQNNSSFIFIDLYSSVFVFISCHASSFIFNHLQVFLSTTNDSWDTPEVRRILVSDWFPINFVKKPTKNPVGGHDFQQKPTRTVSFEPERCGDPYAMSRGVIKPIISEIPRGWIDFGQKPTKNPGGDHDFQQKPTRPISFEPERCGDLYAMSRGAKRPIINEISRGWRRLQDGFFDLTTTLTVSGVSPQSYFHPPFPHFFDRFSLPRDLQVSSMDPLGVHIG